MLLMVLADSYSQIYPFGWQLYYVKYRHFCNTRLFNLLLISWGGLFSNGLSFSCCSCLVCSKNCFQDRIFPHICASSSAFVQKQGILFRLEVFPMFYTFFASASGYYGTFPIEFFCQRLLDRRREERQHIFVCCYSK